VKRAVFLARDAEDDLADLHDYVSESDSRDRADALIDKIEKAVQSLSILPKRGHPPPELDRIGVLDFREIHVEPTRIIYEVAGRDVIVHAVFDGRRDLQDLLARRLLR